MQDQMGPAIPMFSPITRHIFWGGRIWLVVLMDGAYWGPSEAEARNP